MTRWMMALVALFMVFLLYMLASSNGFDHGDGPATPNSAVPTSRDPRLVGVKAQEEAELALSASGPEDETITTISGLVESLEGKPIEEAIIEFGATQARSGGNGAFSVTAAGVEELLLHARKDGYVGRTVRVPMEIGDGLRIVLSPVPTVGGVVLSETGPVVGAALTLSTDNLVYRTRSDEDGAFTFAPLSQSVGVLSASARGYSPYQVRVATGRWAVKRLVWLSRAKSVPVRIRSSDGAPLSGATISAYWSGETWPRLEGVSRSDGSSIEVPCLPSPSRIHVRRSGYVTRRLAVDRVTCANPINVTLVPTETYRLVGAPVPPPGCAWFVAAVTEQDRDAALADEGVVSSRTRIRRTDWTAVDGDGVADVPVPRGGSGEWLVAYCGDESGHPVSRIIVIGRADARSADRAFRGWPRLHLCELRLLFDLGGRDDVVTLSLCGEGHKGSSSQKRLIGGGAQVSYLLAPGDHEVRARLGYDSVVLAVSLTADSPPHLTKVALDPLNLVAGSVFDNEGSALARCQVMLHSEELGQIEAQSDTVGRFQLSGVPGGRYQMYCRPHGSQHVAGPYPVSVPCELIRQQITLCTVVGSIDDFRVDQRYLVWLTDQWGVWNRCRPVDERGCFAFSGIVPGDLQIVVTSADGLAVLDRRAVTVPGPPVRLNAHDE